MPHTITYQEAMSLYDEAEEFMRGSHVSTASELRKLAVENLPNLPPMAATRTTCCEVFRTIARKHVGERDDARP